MQCPRKWQSLPRHWASASTASSRRASGRTNGSSNITGRLCVSMLSYVFQNRQHFYKYITCSTRAETRPPRTSELNWTRKYPCPIRITWLVFSNLFQAYGALMSNQRRRITWCNLSFSPRSLVSIKGLIRIRR